MMVVRVPIVLIAILLNKAVCGDVDPDLLSNEFINSINEEQTLWTAGRYPGRDISMSYFKKLLGVKQAESELELPEIKYDIVESEIPSHFDWRDQYPECTTLRDIRDQGPCGSCWAVSTVEAISDRICIHSKGNLNVYISAEDVTSCCTDCGGGCIGGYIRRAYDFWITRGIVSGGPYESHQGCRPYEIPPCEPVGDSTNCTYEYPTPSCKKSCEAGYSKNFKQDLHFGKVAYTMPAYSLQIQMEIMKNGPVTAGFAVYEDFRAYTKGIYKHTKGRLVGLHAVKILGWGTENNTPYWLIANSWDTWWGEKGYFRIVRGENHCGIEHQVVAGIPK